VEFNISFAVHEFLITMVKHESEDQLLESFTKCMLDHFAYQILQAIGDPQQE